MRSRPTGDEAAAGPDVAALRAAEARLDAGLRACGSALVALSGGVDSAYLTWRAWRILGPGRVLAVTGVGPALAAAQRVAARELATRFGFPWRELPTRELSREGYAANPSDRCYHCKVELYDALRALAGALGLESVLDGANADDRTDYRPGARAARERGVRSPLQEAGLDKATIRALSREAGLPGWDAPASPCLASRLPYGVRVTPLRLRQVERAEAWLRDAGAGGDVRVRHHEGEARVELPPERLEEWTDPARCRATAARLRALGFRRVLLDLDGYRAGSLNRALAEAGV